MKKPRSEMTKKELGKLRYERHYAHVKGKLLKKYKTRPSDGVKTVNFVTMDWAYFQACMDEYYKTDGEAMTSFYLNIQ